MAAVSLSAQPIPPEVAETAAGLSGKLREPLQLLRASRLIRTDANTDQRNIESYHDRIREAVVTEMAPSVMQDWHARLATAWEDSGLARPETLVTHYRAAGNHAKTSQHAEVAAVRAEAALAFDRAAEFYDVLADLARDDREKKQWLEKLGEALVNAGSGSKAAQAFHQALRYATDRDDEIRIQTREAAELIRAAILHDAKKVLLDLLPKVGVRLPENNQQAFKTIRRYYILLRALGTHVPRWFVSREQRAQLMQRVDVLSATSAPFCFVSLVQGNALNVQAVWHAIRSGEPKYLVIALTGLSALESIRGSRYAGRARRLITEAEAVAARLGDPWTRGRTQLADGIFYKANGEWESGVERLETAMATFAACRGVRWEIETAQTLRYDALYWMGDWGRLARELPARRTEAEQRGDQYTINNVAVRFGPLLRMASDQLELAKQEFEESRRRLPEGSFALLDRLETCSGIDLELYARNPEAASDRFEKAWPRLEPMCRVWQNGRIEMLFYRARIALALAAQARNETARSEAIARAEADARALDKEAPWAKALAQLLNATIAHARGESDTALATLEQAEISLNTGHMKHYVAAVQYRQGMLMGGDRGRALIDKATDWIHDHHMVNEARIVDLLSPGPWSTPSRMA